MLKARRSWKCGVPLYGKQMPVAVEKTDFCALFRPISNFNDDGGHRNNTDGQHRPSQKLIQKTALARLEPSEDRDVQAFFLFERAAAFNEIVERRDLMAVTHETNGFQNIIC